MIEHPSKIWHLSHRHLGYGSLNLFSKKTMVDSLPKILESCSKYEACILGKKHMLPFNSHNSKSARAHLQLVHSNLVDPMQTTSIGVSTYFMTFIDDFSCRTWVYFLKSKSNAFDKFLEFEVQDKKESGHYV